MNHPMKTPAESLPIIHNLPEGLTLADLHLENVKVGDEIVTLSRAGNGGLSVNPRLYTVMSVDASRVLVRRVDSATGFGSWLVKNGGGGTYAMHPQNIMRYYYSANPAHVAQARRETREKKEADEARKAAFEAQMVIARPIGEALGDGEQHDNYGTPYGSEIAAELLAEKLTPEQMRTLAGWLGVKMG